MLDNTKDTAKLPHQLVTSRPDASEKTVDSAVRPMGETQRRVGAAAPSGVAATQRPKSATDVIHKAISVLDATILGAWGTHHLWMFFQHPSDPSFEGYLRDGLCLLALAS